MTATQKMPERIHVSQGGYGDDYCLRAELDEHKDSQQYVLATRLAEAEKLLADVLTAEHCPNCPDQGWYSDADGREEQVQVQCEWCERNENSLYQVKFRIQKYRGNNG